MYYFTVRSPLAAGDSSGRLSRSEGRTEASCNDRKGPASLPAPRSFILIVRKILMDRPYFPDGLLPGHRFPHGQPSPVRSSYRTGVQGLCRHRRTSSPRCAPRPRSFALSRLRRGRAPVVPEVRLLLDSLDLSNCLFSRQRMLQHFFDLLLTGLRAFPMMFA